MYSFRHRLAHYVITHRRSAWAFFVLVSLFFAAGLPRVEFKTIFSDLLPADDPFVQVFKDHVGFGSPLTVSVMIKRKDGDLYSAETLKKVWDMTRDIDLTPGVDHDQILSIASTKARYAEATADGIAMQPLMGDAPPSTPEEVARFRDLVDKSPGVRTFMVSADGTATIVSATFIERLVDYGVVFDTVHDLVKNAQDEHHDVYLAGEPIRIGWIYKYRMQMVQIFGITVAALIIALALYMRNLVGVLTPIITSLTATLWAFGFAGWMGIAIEPLLMVVPLLLIARSFSHSVQFTERYYEIYAHVKDKVKAAEIAMGVMLAPSVIGILTDMLGLFVIGVAPIPTIVRHSIFFGVWALWLIPTGVFLISLLLAALPAPKNVDRLIGHGEDSGVHRRFQRILEGIASLSFGKRAPYTTVAVVILAIAAVYISSLIKIGNPVEGTNLLWEDSEFNTSVRAINAHFPGVNTLEIIFEGRDQNTPEWTTQQVETVVTMSAVQRLIEESEFPPRATLSFADFMGEGNRLFSGGNPKWYPIDLNRTAVSAAAFGVMMGSSPKNFSHVIDYNQHNGTVSMWYKDNKQETVDAALAVAREAVATVGTEHKLFTIRLGSGIIALQQAINLVIERFHTGIMVLLNIAVFAVCAFAYRSFVAGLLLLVPVNLSNFILTAAMHLLGIGLDVNSMIVAAIGVGVGIDYGIYLLSRICEEYHAHDGNWGDAITTGLRTTGKAIMFTASIMAIGILPWYFLSDLKFVADMGLLLIEIMTINMLMALVVLPLLVWLFKPKFVERKDLLVGEGVDLSLFTDDAQVDRKLGHAN